MLIDKSESRVLGTFAYIGAGAAAALTYSIAETVWEVAVENCADICRLKIKEFALDQRHQSRLNSFVDASEHA